MIHCNITEVCFMKANRVRAFREVSGISLRELARLVRVCPALMSRAERGPVPFYRGLRRRVADALAIPEERLFPTQVPEARQPSGGDKAREDRGNEQ
jgi:transcriptional regulator with XRE-family HTH domain